VRLSHHSEQGMGMIGVVIGFGLLSAMVYIILTFAEKRNHAKKIANSKELTKSLERAVVAEASAIIKTLHPTHCIQMSKLENRPFEYHSPGALLQFSTAIPDKANLPPIKAAVQRCSEPQLINASNAATKGNMHFCLKLEPSKDDLFIEYSLAFESAKNAATVPCKKIFSEKDVVARVSYGIYFQGSASTYKYGTSIVKLNN